MCVMLSSHLVHPHTPGLELDTTPIEDRDQRCQQALLHQARTDGSFSRHIFQDLVELAHFASLACSLNAPVFANCVTHEGMCPVHRCHMDMTGTPCQDWAPTGNRLGTTGPQMKVFLAWVALVLTFAVPIVVHENVPQFPVEVLESYLGHAYIIFSMVVDCSDVGFRLMSRKRRYSFLYHRQHVRIMCNPVLLYQQIQNAFLPLLPHLAWKIQDCFLADFTEVASEIADLCTARCVSLCQAVENMQLLLTPHELERLRSYLRLWAQRFGLPAHFYAWAVFNLADNPDAGYVTWTAASGRLPSLRTHGAKYWSPWLGRWLTCKELLACMGLPVYPFLAASAGVSLLPVSPGPAARHMLGNMMHLASAGCVLAVALASSQLVSA